MIGIVASRLVERHQPPGRDDRAARARRAGGSGRSIEAFDLLGGLQRVLRAPACATAATARRRAWSSSAAALDEFAAAFAAHASSALGAGDMLVRSERVDAVVRGDELGMELAEELQTLAPFGARQPGGVAAGRATRRFADPRPMGEGRHVRFTVHSRRRRARAGRGVRQRRTRCRWPTASPPTRPSRSRSTSGTASASRGWCCAAPSRRRRARSQPDGGRRGGPTQELLLFALPEQAFDRLAIRYP